MHNFESGAFNFGWRTLNVKPIEENMANFKFLTAALVAGSVLATPAIATACGPSTPLAAFAVSVCAPPRSACPATRAPRTAPWARPPRPPTSTAPFAAAVGTSFGPVASSAAVAASAPTTAPPT